MRDETKIVPIISACLFEHIEGKDSDLPHDEFDEEARLIMEELKSNSPKDPKETAELVRKIFEQTYGEHYSYDVFRDLGDSIFALIGSGDLT